MKRNSQIYCLFCLCALWLMASCGGNGAQMRQQLEALEQQNRSGEQMLNDSLAESLVSYFDKHGDANERMRAKYILGRTYYCLGELPRALETYYEAADCADTTAADCDYKVLSRIHAQSAVIFHNQVQPFSQIKELRSAEYYAWKSKDTLQAIECLSQQSGAYDYLNMPDSVIIICENSSELFARIGRIDRASQMKGRAISSLLKKKEYERSKYFIDEYERCSGLLLGKDSLSRGHEIYYYIKGKYYVAIHQLDSAESLFRKELRDGKDLNNQIAGNKGLQEVFEQREISDSIAKYANIGYHLNDSAYSLSEMQNIQRLSASYNYQHNRQLAQEKEQKARLAYLVLAFVLVSMIAFIMAGLYLFSLYKKKKEKELNHFIQDKHNLEIAKAELESLRSSEQQASEEQILAYSNEIARLQKQVENSRHLYEQRITKLENTIDNHKLIKDLHSKANGNPYEAATNEDFQRLTELIGDLIPTFYTALHSPRVSLRLIEYRVCILIRFHFKSNEIWKLTETSDGYIANLKKRIYHKIFGMPGTAKDLDIWLMNIK